MEFLRNLNFKLKIIFTLTLDKQTFCFIYFKEILKIKKAKKLSLNLSPAFFREAQEHTIDILRTFFFVLICLFIYFFF